MGVLKAWNPTTQRWEWQGGFSGLADMPGALVRRDTVQSIPSATSTPMSWSAATRDSHGFWNPAQPTRLTIPPGMAGEYLVGARITANATAVGQLLAIFIFKNGAAVTGAQENEVAAAGGALFAAVELPMTLAVGDYVESAVFQNIGNPYSVGVAGPGASTPTLWLVRLGGVPGPAGPPAPYIDAPGCLLRRSSAYLLPHNVATILDWDSEHWDTHGFHDNANPSRFAIPSGLGGRYMVEWHLTFAPAVTPGYDYNTTVETLVNGGVTADTVYNTQNAAGTNYSAGQYALTLNPGDVVQLRVSQTASQNVNVYGHFHLYRLITGVTGAPGATGPQGPAGLEGAGVAPTGTILAFAVATPPAGWLLCNGAAVSRATYAALFALLGTAYGVGDGSTTFNVPNLTGRMLLGRNAEALGTTGGAATHTHGTHPNHANHGDHAHYTTTGAPSSVDVAQQLAVIALGDSGHYHGGWSGGVNTVDTHDGHAAHDSPSHLPPYMTMPYIIKT